MSNRVAVIAATLLLLAAPLAAHGRPKRYLVTHDRALIVTREVLGRQGYDVIRVDRGPGPDMIVWYRAGSHGRGRGRGRLVRMVIHREADRVVFLETPDPILVAIDVKLRM